VNLLWWWRNQLVAQYSARESIVGDTSPLVVSVVESRASGGSSFDKLRTSVLY